MVKGWEENFLSEGTRTGGRERRCKGQSERSDANSNEKNAPRTHCPGAQLIFVSISRRTTPPSRIVIDASPRPDRR